MLHTTPLGPAKLYVVHPLFVRQSTLAGLCQTPVPVVACHASRSTALRMLKQAGEGADYVEGYERQRQTRCFKCGGAGHWAAECTVLTQVCQPPRTRAVYQVWIARLATHHHGVEDLQMCARRQKMVSMMTTSLKDRRLSQTLAWPNRLPALSVGSAPQMRSRQLQE